MNNKCVYLLVDKDEVVRYVGQGSPTRPYSISGRSMEYREICKNSGNIILVKTGLTRTESLSLEKELIVKHSTTLINKRSSPSSNRLIYEDLVQFVALSYESPSGLIWKRKVCPQKLIRFEGKRAGGYNSNQSQHGWIVQINGIQLKAHRVIWCLYHKIDITDPDTVINHIDYNPLNNKIENLELVSQRINTMKRSLSKTNTTGVNGICLGVYHGDCFTYKCRVSIKTLRRIKKLNYRKSHRIRYFM